MSVGAQRRDWMRASPSGRSGAIGCVLPRRGAAALRPYFYGE